MKLIFDIGANVGNTTQFFSTVSDKVISFEPNPELFKYLLTRFNTSNVIIDSRGLSDKEEIKVFKIANANTISTFSDDWINKSRFSNSIYNWNQHVDVLTTTLDLIIEQYGIPDYVKIDVEGYELEVLLGLSQLLKYTIFSFEWAEEEYFKILKTIEHVQRLGYNCFGFSYADDILLDYQISWNTWEKLDWHNDINPDRKDKWGMIYFKYNI